MNVIEKQLKERQDLINEIEPVLVKTEPCTQELFKVWEKIEKAGSLLDRSLGGYGTLALHRIMAFFGTNSQDELFNDLRYFLDDVREGNQNVKGVSIGHAADFAHMLVESWERLIELNKYQVNTTVWQFKISEIEHRWRRLEAIRYFEEDIPSI